MNTIQPLLDKLNIPESCRLNKRVFKKLFEENAKLDATDKKALSEDVEEIRWIYTLKPATINIARHQDDVYDYPEIAFLHISLKSTKRLRRLAHVAQHAIPYPLILIFSHGDKVALSVADKRINQADREKWVIEQSWFTDWIDLQAPEEHQKAYLEDCDIHNLPFKNFYDFYRGFQDRIITLNCADKTGYYQPDANPDRREYLGEIERLEREIAELRNTLKKESQFNRRTELNMKIKNRVDQIKAYTDKL